MSKVIQVREVPDDVRDALAAEADARGMSLTKFIRGELTHIARRSQVARENVALTRRTQAAVRGRVPREAIHDALSAGRQR